MITNLASIDDSLSLFADGAANVDCVARRHQARSVRAVCPFTNSEQFSCRSEQIAELHSNGHQVVVVESALLLENASKGGRLIDLADEIWVVSINKAAAVQRIVQRNGLADVIVLCRCWVGQWFIAACCGLQAEAEKRISSQASNADRLARADVILSTTFPFETTVRGAC